MKITKLILFAVTAIIVLACSTTKKSTASMASSSPASTATTTVSPTTTTTTASSNAFIVAKPSNGIYAPGDEELTAIRLQYKDVTLDKLKLGHYIYTAGPCTNCHGAKNIYKIEDAKCKGLIENMAQKARISEEHKDAVYMYVLAIRAAQPKETK